MDYNKELNTIKVDKLNEIIKKFNITDGKIKKAKIENIIKHFTESKTLKELDKILKETPKKEEKKGAGYVYWYKIDGHYRIGKTIIKDEIKLKDVVEKKLGVKATKANYGFLLCDDVSTKEKEIKEKNAQYLSDKGYKLPKGINLI